MKDIPASLTQAVIINCGTKWVTTLALLSALEMAGMPVLVINCESKDGSREHFEDLSRSRKLDFHWLEWPLRPHPEALEQLFAETSAATVLLVDSDVEICSARVIGAMLEALKHDAAAYGAGFVHGPSWLEPPLHNLPKQVGYYAERMWIPLTLLRPEHVRKALRNGISFRVRRPFFEIPGAPRLSKLVGYRFRIPLLRRLKLPRIGKVEFDSHVPEGTRPAFIEYDTGADLHSWLISQGHAYAKVSDDLWNDARHYHGVTRSKIANPLRRLAPKLGLVSKEAETIHTLAEDDARTRLRERFGV